MSSQRPSEAQASPEKRLFISLLTRDISLIDAFLDVVDNSINSAIKMENLALKSVADYRKLLAKPTRKRAPEVKISISEAIIEISDSAGGITFADAENDVFRFGRSGDGKSGDRLSVYGIGLKRAIFKMGNLIDIVSTHPSTGFSLHINVDEWSKENEERWTFKNLRPHNGGTKYGTTIKVSELSEDVKTRIRDSTFQSELITRLSETYVYFLGRLINIEVDGISIKPIPLEIGSNFASEQFDEHGVSCSLSAGIVLPHTDSFPAEMSGWFVFCNGRAVAYADKSETTGWGVKGLLPSFQPKHRPFIGLVFFAAPNPELLPWSTTKSTINQESLLWQHTKRKMAAISREIINFLDRRYSDAGTLTTPAQLREAANSRKKLSLFATIGMNDSKFQTPKQSNKPRKQYATISYKARKSDVELVKKYVGKRGMTNPEVGEYTFRYFLKTEIGGQ
jgi:hypothetical protein